MLCLWIEHGGTTNLMAKPTYPATPQSVPSHANDNLLANPSAVSVGSSIESPPGYPYAGQAPDVNDNVALGVPQGPPYYSIGITYMIPCECGRAIAPSEYGAHKQTENESPYFRQGSDFGDRNVEV